MTRFATRAWPVRYCVMKGIQEPSFLRRGQPRPRPPALVMEWGIMHARRLPSQGTGREGGCPARRRAASGREVWVCFALGSIFTATSIRLALMGRSLSLSHSRWEGLLRSGLVGCTGIPSPILPLGAYFTCRHRVHDSARYYHPTFMIYYLWTPCAF